MAQKRTDDYMCADTSRRTNDRYVKIIPPGVYSGLTVEADGTIAPGVLVTPQGVRIEETTSPGKPRHGDQWQSTGVPLNDSASTRYDLVVCRYYWEAAIPAPSATYRVIQGTPGVFSYPSLPNDGYTYVILAYCRIFANNATGSWDEVVQACAPERLVNCARQIDGSYKILVGRLGALRVAYAPDNGSAGDVASGLNVWMIGPLTYSDGDTINWGNPVFSLSKSGSPWAIRQLNELYSMLTSSSAAGGLSTGPGAARIGVAAKAGTVVSWTASTAQAVLELLSGGIDTVNTRVANEETARLAHVNLASGAHAASAISTTAKSGTSFSLVASTAQSALEALLGGFDGLASTTDANKGAKWIGVAANEQWGITAGNLYDKLINFMRGHTEGGLHKQIVQLFNNSTDLYPYYLLWTSSVVGATGETDKGHNVDFYFKNVNTNPRGIGLCIVVDAFFQKPTGLWKFSNVGPGVNDFATKAYRLTIGSEWAFEVMTVEGTWTSLFSFATDGTGMTLGSGLPLRLGAGGPTITNGIAEKTIGNSESGVVAGSEYTCTASGSKYIYVSNAWKKLATTT